LFSLLASRQHRRPTNIIMRSQIANNVKIVVQSPGDFDALFQKACRQNSRNFFTGTLIRNPGIPSWVRRAGSAAPQPPSTPADTTGIGIAYCCDPKA
jgi:hypothetical protein